MRNAKPQVLKDSSAGPYVLVGVLNWGLGHATRSVPLINALQDNGFVPVLASDGASLDFLENSFPQLPSEEIAAYDIHYGSRLGALVSVAWQMPKMWLASRREHKQLKSLVSKYQPVGIISDNRLGFYHQDVPSVYITHQLKLMLPFARAWFSAWHHRYMRNFQECWIPDYEGPDNLSGEMTNDIDPGVPLRYLNPQTRFSKQEIQDMIYRTCTILSGPEPQRSLLEKKIIAELVEIEGQHLVIRGRRSAETEKESAAEQIEIRNFMDTEDLDKAISQSEIVISRSGYSSLMDYHVLGNKALLIPTPGQPEQEYLARYMLSKGWFYYVDQERMDLTEDLEKAQDYRGLSSEDFKESPADWRDLLSLFQGKGKGGA